MSEELLKHYKQCIMKPDEVFFNPSLIPGNIDATIFLELLRLSKQVVGSERSNSMQKQTTCLMLRLIMRKTKSCVVAQHLVASDLWQIVTKIIRQFKRDPGSFPPTNSETFVNSLITFAHDLSELSSENKAPSSFKKFYTAVMSPMPIGAFINLLQNLTVFNGSPKSVELVRQAQEKLMVNPETPHDLKISISGFFSKSQIFRRISTNNSATPQEIFNLKSELFKKCEEDFLYRYCPSSTYHEFEQSIHCPAFDYSKTPGTKQAGAVEAVVGSGMAEAGGSQLDSKFRDTMHKSSLTKDTPRSNRVSETNSKLKMKIFGDLRDKNLFEGSVGGSLIENDPYRQSFQKPQPLSLLRPPQFILNRQRFNSLKEKSPKFQSTYKSYCFLNEIPVYQDQNITCKAVIRFPEDNPATLITCFWDLNNDSIREVKVTLNNSKPRLQHSAQNKLNWVFEADDFRETPKVSISYRMGSNLTVNQSSVVLPVNKVARLIRKTKEQLVEMSQKFKFVIGVNNVLADTALFFSLKEAMKLFPGSEAINSETGSALLSLPNTSEPILLTFQIREFMWLSLNARFNDPASEKILQDFMNELLFVMVNLNLASL